MVIAGRLGGIGIHTSTQHDCIHALIESGIGPFIEARLNGIGIFTFAQIAAMTAKVEDQARIKK